MAELIRCRNVHTGAFATLNKDALRFFPDYVAHDGPDPDEELDDLDVEDTTDDLEDDTDAEDSADKEEE